MKLCALFLLTFEYVVSYKFLAYSPQFATSHVTFMGRITDALIDAGHEVVMLAPMMDTTVKGPGTSKARVITLPQADKGDIFEYQMTVKLVKQAWTYESVTEFFSDWDVVFDAWQSRCNATVHYHGLIEQLREEKFDVAFGEMIDLCMPGLFHTIGIDKWAVTDSLAMNDGHFFYTHTPTNPAYVPGLMSAEGGEAMTFMQRLKNTFMIQMSVIGQMSGMQIFDSVFTEVYPDFPGTLKLAGLNSLVFTNSEPLVDFPRPTSARMIDIGGIAVSNAPNPLNQTWSSILSLRPKTVIISFGSFAKAYLMPDHYKKTLIETVKKFPDLTFIWKYEKPEHNVSKGVDNLIETTWMPQNDILHDPRLSAFITHCGQGSTTEANYAGVPLIVIPVAFDQLRNAEQMRRIGVGIVLERKDLASVGPLENAIAEILNDKKFKNNALKLKQTLLERPFSMKEVFVRNMEFLAKHGPLRQLDHYGKELNLIQYYLIDIIAAVICILLIVVTIVLLILRAVFKMLLSVVRIKKVKNE